MQLGKNNLKAGNGLNIRSLWVFLWDFSNRRTQNDVPHVGRVAPLPHVGRAGLLEVPARGLDFNLGREKTKGGAVLSRVLVTLDVAETTVMSNGQPHG